MEESQWHLVYNFSNWSQLASIDYQPFDFWFSYFERKSLSKQIVWGVNITRVEEAFIPDKYGMGITSHYNPISYGKLILAIILFFLFLLFPCRYNQVDKHLKDKALQCIISREFKGNSLLVMTWNF
jgi:hypothetical protein